VSLPLDPKQWYTGIDPGFSGAMVRINADGTSVKAFKLPVHRPKKAVEFNLPKLWAMFTHMSLLPSHAVGIEWPTTRPGEGAERSERFGRGKGYLHAFAVASGCEHYLISPALWKGRLGLEGKAKNKDATRNAATLMLRYYPQAAEFMYGPRGGPQDGPIDALCIAHFMRTRTFTAMRGLVEQYGKDSPEVWAAVMQGGKKRRKKT